MASNSQLTPGTFFIQSLGENRPQAIAWVTGDSSAPGLSGLVQFYDTQYGGVLVKAEFFGLPDVARSTFTSNFYAMHIHEYGDCSAGFSRTGEHYNPDGVFHPDHAGDMPPLLSNQGYAWIAFYDKRFTVKDILHRSLVIHSQSDDFRTQPSGCSGNKIGCGVILPTEG